MNKRFVVILAVSVGFFVGVGQNVEAWEPCKSQSESGPPMGRSVQQLVNEASYIATFRVVTVVQIDQAVHGSAESFYNYTLESSSELHGIVPKSIEVIGLKPYEVIPQHYFAIDSLHSGIDPEDPEKLGLAIPVVHPKSGKCEFVPRFFVGYYYLVFGGINSQINHELIPSKATDKWYHLVVDAAAARREK